MIASLGKREAETMAMITRLRRNVFCERSFLAAYVSPITNPTSDASFSYREDLMREA